MEPPLARAVAEIEAKQESATKLGKKADRIEAYCARETGALETTLDHAVLSLQRVPLSEVRVLTDIRFPTEGMTAVMRAVCLLRGVAPKKVREIVVIHLPCSEHAFR